MPTPTLDASAEAVPQPPADGVPTEVAQPDPAHLPPGVVGIYLSSTLNKDSSLFRDANTGPILLESSTNGVVLLNADTGSSSVIATSRSPSYSRNRLLPVTSEGKLLILTEYSSGNVYYDEYDPASSAIIGAVGRRLPDNTDQYAISGETAYYVKEIERLGQPTQRRLIRYDLLSGETDDLGSFAAGGGGYVLTWGGLAYFVTLPFEGTPIIKVYALYPTGPQGPQIMALGQVNGFDQYAAWSLQNPVVSDGHIYWLGIIDSGLSAQVEIWSYNLEQSTGQFELFRSFEVALPGATSVPLFDVDANYFVASVESGQGQKLLLFDSATDDDQVIDIDIVPYALAVLYRRE